MAGTLVTPVQSPESQTWLQHQGAWFTACGCACASVRFCGCACLSGSASVSAGDHTCSGAPTSSCACACACVCTSVSVAGPTSSHGVSVAVGVGSSLLFVLVTCAVVRLCQCGDPQKVGWSTKLPSAALSGLCPASLTQPDLTRTLSWAFSFCILSDSSSLCFFSFLFVFMSSIAHSYRSYEYPACHRNLFSSLRGRFHLILHIFLETRHPH